MKVKVTLDNKWYHLDKIVNCIDGNELLGAIKKQSNKQCITFSGRAKRVNDEWVFEPNVRGKNYSKFEACFSQRQKESSIKLLSNKASNKIFKLFKLDKPKKVALPVRLANGKIVNIWVNKYITDDILRGLLNFYIPKENRQFTISGLVIRNNLGKLSFIPYKGKHFFKFQTYLGVSVSPVIIDTIPFSKGLSVGVEVKPGVIKYAKLLYNFENKVTCQLSFRFNGTRYLIDGVVYKGGNTFEPLKMSESIYKIYKQYLESR